MSNAKPSSLDAQLLTDLQGYFARQQGKCYPTEQLLDYLAGIGTAPWATFADGKAITARHLARLLQPYGIMPKTIRFPDGLAKGYKVADFADAFVRSFVTDKVVDKVNVTDRIESAKGNVTDRRPVLADRNVADNVVDMADRKRVVTTPVQAQPQRKWPPPKGWAWNRFTQCYESPKPTIQPDPPDQARIRQTLHVSPSLQYLPGYGLVALHEAEPCL